MTHAPIKYRDFQIGRDLPPLLSSTFLVHGETNVVYAAREAFTFSFEVPGREVRGKPTGEEGKPRVSAVVVSPSPAGLAVQVGDALASQKVGVILTDRRLAVFNLVPADPSLKEPSFMDGLRDLGRTLRGKEEFPPYPMVCSTVMELPASMVSYQGVHKEKPRNCVKADYHRIAFHDGSTLGLLT
jgi:hypothetical protein